MAPQSRGPPVPTGFQSKSTPNLPTLRSLKNEQLSITANATPATIAAEHPDDTLTSPSEPASIEDFSLDAPDPDLSSGSSSEEDNSPLASLPPQRPLYGGHQHSRSHTYLGPSSFAPPFYNRPPTPLPPSPSLTSLLRPNFSSQNSRPSTPDPSSDEGPPSTSATAPNGTNTPNSNLTTAYRAAKPVPRASPKVPTYEYYGFTLYLTSSLAFIVYLLWSYLPSPFLHQLGIYYYPNRWWSLAIPAWLVMCVLYIYVALAAYNTGYLTLPLDSVACMVDEAANVAVVDGRGRIVRSEKASWAATAMGGDGKGSLGRTGRGKNGGHSRQSSGHRHGFLESQEPDWRNLWNEGTDAVMDIPIGGVCEILYGQASDTESVVSAG